MYLEPIRTSTMEVYAKKNNGLIVDIQLGSKYVSENGLKSPV